jgi:hypothetical protein
MCIVNRLLNKDYPLIVRTEDLDQQDRVDLEQDRIMSQIKKRNLKLEVGAQLWITDGLADGRFGISKNKNRWIATNQKSTNRFVSANWPFHINNKDK